MPAVGLIGIYMVIIGIRLQTWMRLMLDVDVYDKIIARDLRLVTSQLYGTAVTWPGSRSAVTQKHYYCSQPAWLGGIVSVVLKHSDSGILCLNLPICRLSVVMVTESMNIYD
jgi:hypothetical protein